MRRLLLVLPLLVPVAALADDAAPATADDIIVTGVYARQQTDILQSTNVLKAEDLQRDLRPTIGDTLLSQPGISATSFGPGVSRPVIRGQQGERVRVLVDGIGSIDASNTSADHAAAGDTLTAERVEVLRGPATLLFGSSAIGGVVNIIDSRIPATLQEETLRGTATALFGSAANEWGGGATVNAKIAPGVVVHADGSYRDSGDTRIGSSRVSQALADAIGFDRDEDDERKLPNSDAEVKSGAIGATFYTNGGDDFFGFAVSRFLTNYGSPIEEEVRIDLKQTRIDMKAGLTFDDGFVQQAKWRFGWADYKHSELEGEEVGTTFLNKGWEMRAELVQRQQGPWRGAFGAQLMKRDFKVIGEEAFVPANITQQLGLFTLQELDLSPFKLEASARFERTSVEAPEDAITRRFSSFSAALGGAWSFTDKVQIGASIARAVRAPAAEELFANGPHIATGVFEIGDPTLKLEKAWNAELNIHAHGDRFELHGALYYTWFKDYVFEQFTGEIDEESGLPITNFVQRDARYYGFEVEAAYTAWRDGDRKVVVNMIADYVRATNSTDNQPLPRIPALRLRGGIGFESAAFDVHGEVEWAARQKRVAPIELPTASYTTANLSATWRPLGRDAGLSLVLEGNNLFDAEIRRHASFTKDIVPSAGRDIRVSARWVF